MSDKSTNRLICWVGCIALTLIGFEYQSGWAFVGAVLAFFGAVD